MKKLFISIVVFLVVFTFGCQESAINGPEESAGNIERKSSEGEGTTFNDFTVHNKGVINIKSELTDPVLKSPLVLLGRIAFDHHTSPGISIQVNSNKIVRLDLKVEAELFDGLGAVDTELKIAGRSSHRFEFLDDRIYSLKIIYQITNRKDISLRVTYPVTADGLEEPTFNLIPNFGAVTSEQ